MIDVVIDLWSIPAAAVRVQRRRPAVPPVPVPSLAKPLVVTAALAVTGLGAVRTAAGGCCAAGSGMLHRGGPYARPTACNRRVTPQHGT